MARFLTSDWLEEWLRQGRDQPLRPGVTVRLQYVVQGAPGGDTLYYWIVKDGRLQAVGFGEPPGGAQLTLTLNYESAKKIALGEISANMAFMRGWVKASGQKAMLMTLLPITGSAAYKDAQAKVAAVTDYSTPAAP